MLSILQCVGCNHPMTFWTIAQLQHTCWLTSFKSLASQCTVQWRQGYAILNWKLGFLVINWQHMGIHGTLKEPITFHISLMSYSQPLLMCKVKYFLFNAQQNILLFCVFGWVKIWITEVRISDFQLLAIFPGTVQFSIACSIFLQFIRGRDSDEAAKMYYS